MNRKAIPRILVILLIAVPLRISTTVLALPYESHQAQQTSLPHIVFLGQGPQTFTIEPPLHFLVKTYQNGQFLFEALDGPTYKAKHEERVWTIDTVPTEDIRLFDETKSYGIVEAGCVINYVQIEDNVDARRNTFYINGKVLQVVEQGMVTYGSFTVPETGELTFFAEDSIGMILEPCQSLQTGTPGVSTNTPAVTPTETATVPVITPTPTATATAAATDTLTPTTVMTPTTETATPAAAFTPTPTSTAPSIVLTLEPSSTPQIATSTRPAVFSTQSASATAQIIRITATPVSTLALFPVTGGGPGSHEIAVISLTILGLSLLVGAAWWFLVRAFVQRR